jgi:membrane protein implicated in regulation of membrane protease activity
MHQIRRAIEVIFVLTLAAFLLSGVMFVTGQATALIAGQAEWLEFFNTAVKTPMCAAASVCAVAGFLLSYKHSQKQAQTAQEATR